jgi:hypothetical protein
LRGTATVFLENRRVFTSPAHNRVARFVVLVSLFMNKPSEQTQREEQEAFRKMLAEAQEG